MSDPDYGRISELQTEMGVGGKSLVELTRSKLKSVKTDNIYVTTDVNAAALGELCIRADKRSYPFDNLENGQISMAFKGSVLVSLYFGKGIGGGIAFGGGELWQRRSHPEMGHIHIGRMKGDTRKNICPHHTDCITGFAGWDSFKKVNGRLSDRELDMLAYYISSLCSTVSYIVSPNVILIGGSTFSKIDSPEDLLERVHVHLKDIFRGKRKDDCTDPVFIMQENSENIHEYVGLFDEASPILGTILFGAREYKSKGHKGNVVRIGWFKVKNA
jgi:hypothetical protein